MKVELVYKDENIMLFKDGQQYYIWFNKECPIESQPKECKECEFYDETARDPFFICKNPNSTWVYFNYKIEDKIMKLWHHVRILYTPPSKVIE
jgi:hypothetical protein